MSNDKIMAYVTIWFFVNTVLLIVAHSLVEDDTAITVAGISMVIVVLIITFRLK